MLNLKRSRGQAIMVETPAGTVEIRVLAANAYLQEATLDVTLPAGLPPVGVRNLSAGDRLTIPVEAGAIELLVQGFDVGPGEHQHAMSVRLGIDAPREWTVLRDNAKGSKPT